MSQKVIAHKREPTGSLLKQRISSISSDSLKNATNDSSKASSTEKSSTVQKLQTPEDKPKARRQALRDFYKLRDQQLQMLNNVRNGAKMAAEKKNVEQLSVKNLKALELTPATFDEYVSKVDFVQLLLKEDEILEELGNDQSETKSIVYNNYYELIKINDILMNIKEKGKEAMNSAGGRPVKENLLNVRKNLDILKELDKDVFGSKNGDLRSIKDDPTSFDEAQAVCHGINRLILSKHISKDIVQQIDKIVPCLKNESIILKLN